MKVSKCFFMLLGISLATQAPPAFSANPENSGVSKKEYGSLYIIEEQDREVPKWRISLGGNYEFGNPYSNIYGITQTFERGIGKFFWVGIRVTEFLSNNSALTNVLQSQLQNQNFGLLTETPLYSASAIGTVVPFSGHFNFFGAHPRKAEIGFRLGLGSMWYQNVSPRFLLSWALLPSIEVTDNIGVYFSFGQDIESIFHSSDQSTRTRGEMGLKFYFY